MDLASGEAPSNASNQHLDRAEALEWAVPDADSLQREIADLRVALGKIRINQRQLIVADKLELRKLECDIMAAEKRVVILLRDSKDRNAMLEYAGLILTENPGAVDSSYALKLQGQIEAATGQANDFWEQLTKAERERNVVMNDLREKVMRVTANASKGEVDYYYREHFGGDIKDPVRFLVVPKGRERTSPSFQPSDVDALQREAADLRADIQSARTRHEQEHRSLQLQLSKLGHSKLEADKHMATLLLQLNDKLPDIDQYASIVHEADQRKTISSLVLHLQAELAKALHKRGVLENQVLLTQQASVLARQELIDIVKSSECFGEADYRNQLREEHEGRMNQRHICKQDISSCVNNRSSH